MFLTRDQVQELTGTRVRAKQLAWLARQGILHWQNVAGRVVVPVSAIEGRKSEPPKPEWKPRKAA